MQSVDCCQVCPDGSRTCLNPSGGFREALAEDETSVLVEKHHLVTITLVLSSPLWFLFLLPHFPQSLSFILNTTLVCSKPKGTCQEDTGFASKDAPNQIWDNLSIKINNNSNG